MAPKNEGRPGLLLVAVVEEEEVEDLMEVAEVDRNLRQ